MTGRLVQMSGVIVDMVYRVVAVPRPGEEAQVLGARVAAGGGFNAMVAARRAGMWVGWGGSLGTGPLADLVDRALRDEGIMRLRDDRIAGHDQGCCTVLVDATGERTFIAATAADGMVRKDQIQGLPPRPDDWLLLSGYALTYPESREALAAWARALPPGSRLVFDPAPRVASIPAPCLRAALEATLWVSANRDEAAILTGTDDPAHAAEALAKGRAGGALVRVGAGGCWLATPGTPAQHIPGHAVRAIDTNGAGDAHTGHFIAALARGEDPAAAARIANVAAALSTTEEGPSTAPTLTRTLAALAAGPETLVLQRR